MSVGIGKASDLQVNVTVCPMQDIDVDEVRPCMTAGSVNYQRKKKLLLSHHQSFLPPIRVLNYAKMPFIIS